MHLSLLIITTHFSLIMILFVCRDRHVGTVFVGTGMILMLLREEEEEEERADCCISSPAISTRVNPLFFHSKSKYRPRMCCLNECDNFGGRITALRVKRDISQICKITHLLMGFEAIEVGRACFHQPRAYF